MKVIFVSIDKPSRWSQWHCGRTERVYYSDFLPSEKEVTDFILDLKNDYPDSNLISGTSDNEYFIKYVVLDFDEQDEMGFKNLCNMMGAYEKYQRRSQGGS